MATIVTRAGKASPLTNQELDSNFNNLNTDKAELSGAVFTGAITTNSTIDGRDVAADGVTADAALPKAGGAMTGAITTNSTFDGVDIATRDAVLTSTTTTANAALPKAGGAMSGAITTNSTFDGRDVATDGTKLDGIEASATADQTGAQIKTAYEAETNAFTDAQFTKLGGIAASADVTANAGALMDSELTSIASVKALNQGVATGDSPSFAGIVATTADINGGTIDGTVIGGATPAAISGTTGTFSSTLGVTGIATFTTAIKGNRDISAFGANTGSSANRMAMSMEGAGVSRLICNGPDGSTNGTFEVFTAYSGGTGSVKLGIDAAGAATFASTVTTAGLTTTSNVAITGGSYASVSAGSGRMYGSSVHGLVLQGSGTTRDFLILDKNGDDRVYIDSTGIDVTGTVVSDALTVQPSTFNKISSYFSGTYTSGFKFSDMNGGIWYDAGADDLTVSAGHANSQLIFESGGSASMTLDASGNVGLGTVPSATHSAFDTLEFVTASITSQHSATNGNLVLGSNMNYSSGGGPEYKITGKATQIAQVAGVITLGVAASGTANTNITFNNGLEVLNDGKARAKNGLLFGTDTASENTLDSYEEGTWTPAASSDASATAYNYAIGYFTKIGRKVHVTGQFRISTIGSFAGAIVNISGLPFNIANITTYDPRGMVGIKNAATAKGDIFLRGVANTNYMRLEANNGNASSDRNCNANVFDTATICYVDLTYFVA